LMESLKTFASHAVRFGRQTVRLGVVKLRRTMR
jgi:hypothetical protein